MRRSCRWRGRPGWPSISRSIASTRRRSHRSDCIYTDPNPLSQINNQGHNYFLSQNPTLNSYAGFGEANYNLFSDLKVIAGLRWTEDQKRFHGDSK